MNIPITRLQGSSLEPVTLSVRIGHMVKSWRSHTPYLGDTGMGRRDAEWNGAATPSSNNREK